MNKIKMKINKTKKEKKVVRLLVFFLVLFFVLSLFSNVVFSDDLSDGMGNAVSPGSSSIGSNDAGNTGTDNPSSGSSDTGSNSNSDSSNSNNRRLSIYGSDFKFRQGNSDRPLSISGSDFKFRPKTSKFKDYDFSLSRINEYSDYIYSLTCNCKFDDSCSDFLNVYCANTKDFLPDYLKWTVDFFKNPVNTVCNSFLPNINYKGLGVSLNQESLSDQTMPSNNVNAYIQAARSLQEDTYFYYFKFYFSPKKEYSSNNIVFKFLISGAYENADFDVEESNSGFTLIKTLNTNKNIEKVCMYFDPIPEGFSSNYFCADVVDI